MKTITLAYWYGKEKDLEYEHGQTFEYSDEKRNELFNEIISKGLSVMAIPREGDLIMWIGKGKLTQR